MQHPAISGLFLAFAALILSVGLFIMVLLMPMLLSKVFGKKKETDEEKNRRFLNRLSKVD